MTRRYFCWRRAFLCLEEILKEIGKEIREEIPKEIQMKIRKERDTFGEGESSLGEPSSVRKPESVSKASSLQLCLLFSEGMWNLWKFELTFTLTETFPRREFFVVIHTSFISILYFTCLFVQSFSLIFASWATEALVFWAQKCVRLLHGIVNVCK